MTDDWPGLVLTSFLRPRHAAKRIKEWQLDVEVAFQIGTLSIVVGTMISAVFFRPDPSATSALPFLGILTNPLLWAVVQIVIFLGSTALIVVIGRNTGGTGTFRDALGLMAWFQVVSTILSIVQTLVLLVVPILGGIVVTYFVVWVFWALSAFIAETHDFDRGWAVFGGLIVTVLVISVLLSLVAGLLGIQPAETL